MGKIWTYSESRLRGRGLDMGHRSVAHGIGSGNTPRPSFKASQGGENGITKKNVQSRRQRLA